jgi:RimJ/RimL family protein N-acetyltransferase
MKTLLQYRKLDPAALHLYKTIRLECLQKYPNNFGTTYEEEVETVKYKFDDIISNGHETDFLMGAFNDEVIIGICGFIQEKRLKTKHVGELSQMFVKHEYNGMGIGYHLLLATINEAFKNNDLQKIILAVAENNTAAQHVYKKCGFKQYGKLENYFKHNDMYETQLFMALDK